MKKGISLIVLVITIIVMIILAASVVITLSNTGVINKANDAVDLTNQAQVQDMASIVWAEAYIDGDRGADLETTVKNKLKDEGITEDKWNVVVTDKGVTVTGKNPSGGNVEPLPQVITLGSLITKDNYGDTVDYEVTVNGTKYSDWKIMYHNSEYVYLITSESIGSVTLDKGTAVSSLTAEEMALYEKFRVGNEPKYTLIDTYSDGSVMSNCKGVAQLIKDYSNFANTTTYGTNVVGAIGGPTVELVVAGWNAKEYDTFLYTTLGEYGYNINNNYFAMVENDGLYVQEGDTYWLASPAVGFISTVMIAGDGAIADAYVEYSGGAAQPNGYARSVRPVVCLKTSIPATVGTGDCDFSLTK